MPNEARAGILQGTLDLMILHTLALLGPLHGYAIAARLELAAERPRAEATMDLRRWSGSIF
jgi:DNA-binding PadR family transcriptional regulator